MSPKKNNGTPGYRYYCPLERFIRYPEFLRLLWVLADMQTVKYFNLVGDEEGIGNKKILTREDFDYWLRQLPHDKSLGDDELTYEMWQEAPAEIKDVLYQVVNVVVQNGKMEGALTTLIPKKVGEEKILESIHPIRLMNTASKIVTSVWFKRLSKSLEQQSVLEGSQEGFRLDRSTR